jgi:hypothetical protein
MNVDILIRVIFLAATIFVTATDQQSSGPDNPSQPLVQPRWPDGSGAVEVSGELKQWHKVTLTLDGPFAHERDSKPNPFTDYRMTVTFVHESGQPRYEVPGYFAADGNAAESSAEAGTRWRAHLSPDKPGKWTYSVDLKRGRDVAQGAGGGHSLPAFSRTGSFVVAPTDKTGRDFRAKGRLQYTGKQHLMFTGTREHFLKAGADSPENLLAYVDFDGTRSNKRRNARPGEAIPAGLKTWQPHLRDWKTGDPVWKQEKGKGLIGALNYLAGKGCNAFSFLTYNAGGDGDDVWPFVEREAKLHYDCSRLDQWGIVFDHATRLGLYLHFKLQETEIDDNRVGNRQQPGGPVAESLDGGLLGKERKLYCRELIARFGHSLAINWNLGEENTQSPEEQRAMAQYIRDVDPYDHPIVVHTYPDRQDQVYPPLLGNQSALTGASLQNGWDQVHRRTLRWLVESGRAGRPWVVANDEQNPANLGVPPDPGFQGFDGMARERQARPYDLNDIRKLTLWGNLMAGGAGVEYYFGYELPQNDLACEDWRSRDRSWDYCSVALEFFQGHKIPFWDMQNADQLVGNDANDNSKYCLAKRGDVYVVYLPSGGVADLDLESTTRSYRVEWFNPRAGGGLQQGSIARVKGPGKVALGAPPADAREDWVVLVR